MKVFMIGGTGLLGAEAATQFIAKGHSVKSMALPPVPQGADIPKEMEIVFGNYLTMSDEEIKEMMAGCDCFVFAAGVDERVEFPAPVYAAYEKFNINPVKRLIPLAKEVGIKKTVVLGSYFAYFAKKYPDMKLTEKHPYIRSRIDQENAALALADENMDVSVLELPYIFGTQPGRRPVWTILIEQIQGMKPVTMYPRGGTAMVTVRQVGEVIVGAAERSTGAKAWPVGYYNLTWNEFLDIVHEAMGQPGKKIVNVPKWTFQAFGLHMRNVYKKKNVEGGIDPVGLADIMCMNTFIDRKWCVELGVQEDDIKSAIFDSIKLSVDAVNGTQQLIGMKGE